MSSSNASPFRGSRISSTMNGHLAARAEVASDTQKPKARSTLITMEAYDRDLGLETKKAAFSGLLRQDHYGPKMACASLVRGSCVTVAVLFGRYGAGQCRYQRVLRADGRDGQEGHETHLDDQQRNADGDHGNQHQPVHHGDAGQDDDGERRGDPRAGLVLAREEH